MGGLTKKKGFVRKNSAGARPTPGYMADRLCNPNPKNKNSGGVAVQEVAAKKGGVVASAANLKSDMKKRLADHEATLRSNVAQHKPKPRIEV